VQIFYRKMIKEGKENCEIKFYEKGRHEMLNEINREEVYADVLGWITRVIRK
jgi:alpha-beta hydrolase superfamily lysophospholipase